MLVNFISRRHRACFKVFLCYRPRSAIGEVGKVFGLTEDITANLSSSIWGSWGSSVKESHIRQGRLDPANKLVARAMAYAETGADLIFIEGPESCAEMQAIAAYAQSK